jgi:hypothetical protein
LGLSGFIGSGREIGAPVMRDIGASAEPWLGLTLEAGRDRASKFVDAQLFDDIGAAPIFSSCKSRIKDARLPYAAGSAVNESKLPFEFGADTGTSPCHDLGAIADSRFCFNQRHGRLSSGFRLDRPS